MQLSSRCVWATLALFLFGSLAINAVKYQQQNQFGHDDSVAFDPLSNYTIGRANVYRGLTPAPAVRGEQRRLKQDFAPGVECAGETIGSYDEALKEWTVPFEALSSLQLDEIVNCANQNDSVVLELMTEEDSAKIDRTITITKSISLTATVAGGPARLKLTCPDDESPVFDVQVSEVFLENIEIFNCNLTKGTSPFTVSDGVAKLRLHRFSFQNNRHTNNAATISFSNSGGSLNLTAVQFHGNNGNGDFVARLPGETDLKDVDVSENYAQLAVLHFPPDANCSVFNLTASANTVTVMRFQQNSNVTVSNSIFAGNENQGSETQGGVMSVTNSTVTVEGCAFLRNFADKGGAIFAVDSDITISDSTNFIHNRAHEGGGCFFDGGKVRIESSAFHRNSATDDGGAIRSSSTELTLTKSECRGNRANNSGGCFVFEDFSIRPHQARLRIFQSKLKGNEAKLAGALKVERSNVAISRSRFIGNHASNTAGCAYFDDSEGEVTESLFEENTAAYGGGAYVHDCNRLVVLNTTFSSNQAVQLGGAVDVDLGSIEFQNVTLKNNKAALGGGLYYFKGAVTRSLMKARRTKAPEGEVPEPGQANVAITEGIFKGNKAVDGGGLYVSGENLIVRIHHCQFEDNMADTMGGAVYARTATRGSTMLEFKHVSFASNKASMIGGACHLFSVSSNFSDCNFIACAAEAYGGALSIWKIPGTEISETEKHLERIHVRRSNFKENTAKFGGAISAREVQYLSIKSTAMFSNRIKNGKGGAIYGDRIDDVVLRNLAVAKNKADGDGGGLFFISCNIQIEKLKVQGNHGRSGGGMMLLNTKNAAVNNSIFKNNSASEYGGGIRLDSSHIEAHWLSVNGNNAVSGGGVSSSKRSKIVCSNCRFRKNNAIRNGGGVSSSKRSKIVCSDCQFKKNTATGNGGAIEIASAGRPRISARLENLTGCENEANLGGAIYFFKSYKSQKTCNDNSGDLCEIVIVNAAFSNNTAKSGSVIHSNAENLIFVNCSHQNLSGLKLMELAMLCQLEDARRADDCRGCVASQNSGPAVSGYASNVVLKFEDKCESDGDSCDRYKITWSENCTMNGKQSDYCLYDFVPGRTLPSMKVIPVDAYGNPNVPVYGEFKPTLQDLSRILLVGNIAASETDDKWEFVPVETSNPLGKVEHKSLRVFELHVVFNGSKGLDNVTIRVKRRECRVGEIEKNSGVLCEACDDNTYSFDPGNGNCRPCPLNGNCAGDFVFPQPGYWQRSPCDVRIVECLNSDACNGQIQKDGFVSCPEREHRRAESVDRSNASLCFGETLDNGCQVAMEEKLKTFKELQCSEGYGGPLCGVCSKGYSRSGNYKCNQCSPAGWYIAIVMLAMLFTVAVVAVMIRGNHVSSRELVSAVLTRRNLAPSSSNGRNHAGLIPAASLNASEAESFIAGRPPEELRTAHQAEDVPEHGIRAARREQLAKWKICEILKIIINFLQSIAVATVINVEWARFVRGLLQASDIASGASIEVFSNAVYCLCQEYSIRRSELSYYVVLATPLFLVFVFSLFYADKSRYREYNFGFCARRILLSLAAVLFLNYLNVTRETVEVFVSVKVPSFEPHAEDSEAWTRYWVSDTYLEFLASDHRLLFILASVVAGVYTLGFPMMSAVTLYQSYIKGHLGSNGVVYDILGFMYRGYDFPYCYWESIVMLRKACLSIIAVFSYSLEGTTQGMLATFVLVISLFLHTWVHPFRREFEIINMFESYSLIVSCQTFILSSFFVEDNASEKVRTFLSLYLGLCIIGFFLYLVCELIEAIIDLLRVKLETTYPACRRELSSPDVVRLWWLHCFAEVDVVNEHAIQLAAVAAP